MNTKQISPVPWTVEDLVIFDGDRNHRYEIIDGELFVTRALHWKPFLNIQTLINFIHPAFPLQLSD